MICPICGRTNREGARFCDGCAANIIPVHNQAMEGEPLNDSPTGLVGRQHEMQELLAALADAGVGRGRVVMLAGEPGIGKTRLAEEVETYSIGQGFQVLWGRCYEGEGAPPYWPWVQALSSYLPTREPGQIAEDLGAGAAEVSQIIPELKGLFPDLPPPPDLEPEQARFLLFESFTAFLTKSAQRQPLLLVLDDLHWADAPSLLLLEFLALHLSGSSIVVLGCYRDMELSRQHPLSESLSRLSRTAGFHREIIRGLNHSNVAHFLERGLSYQPSDGLVETVFQNTEGNPFFMTEILRLLQEQEQHFEDPEIHSSELRIPEGIKEVIGQRLNRLSPPCVQILTTAAVVGREFDFNLLLRLENASSENDLLLLIEEAVSARLIEEVPHRQDRYSFIHALFQQTLAEEVTSSRRVRLHGRIGHALEEMYGNEAESHASELANHFYEAESAIGSERCLHYSRLAGERALSTYAHEEALLHFQRALALKEGHPLDDEMANLIFGLGRSQLAVLQSHELGTAVATLEQAFSYYVTTGDVQKALAVVDYPGYEAVRHPGMRDLIASALELVPAESHEAGRLLARYANALEDVGGAEARVDECLGKALAISQREHDTHLELRTLSFFVSFLTNQLRYAEALEKCRQAISLAPKVDDLRIQVQAGYFLVTALTTTGNLQEARRQVDPLLAAAEKLRDRFWTSSALWKAEIVSRIAGHWESARRLADQGLAIAPQYPNLLADRTLLEAEVGESAVAEAYYARLQDSLRRTIDYGTSAMATASASRISQTMGDTPSVQAMAQRVLESSQRTIETARAETALALLAIEQGEAVEAKNYYQLMAARRGTMIYWVIQADRLLGLLAKTMGNPESAVVHFTEALTFCENAGYQPELAWTCHDFAELLIQEPTKQLSKTNPFDLIEQGLSIAHQLGMSPLIEKLNSLETAAPSRAAAGSSLPDGLTRREVEVLKLVAQGFTDRQIADKLIISINTVGNHVRSILGKTASANRAEASTYAALHGMIENPAAD